MPEICLLTGGSYNDVCQAIGGGKNVWIGNFKRENKYTYDVNNVIDGVAAGTPELFLFVHDAERIAFNQTGDYSEENNAVRQNLVLSIKGFDLDADARNKYLELVKAPMFAIVEAENGLFYMGGVDTPGRAFESNAGIGLLQTDQNGYNISFRWKSKNGLFLVDPEILNAPDGITLIDSIIS